MQEGIFSIKFSGKPIHLDTARAALKQKKVPFDSSKRHSFEQSFLRRTNSSVRVEAGYFRKLLEPRVKVFILCAYTLDRSHEHRKS